MTVMMKYEICWWEWSLPKANICILPLLHVCECVSMCLFGFNEVILLDFAWCRECLNSSWCFWMTFNMLHTFCYYPHVLYYKWSWNSCVLHVSTRTIRMGFYIDLLELILLLYVFLETDKVFLKSSKQVSVPL